MAQPQKLAVVGAGLVGQRHIAAINQVPGVELVAVVEPGPSDQTVPVYPDLDALFAASDVDGIILSTPTLLHVQGAMACVERGIPVLIEKPLVTRIEDVEPVRAAVAAHPAPVWVAMEYRYMPPVTRLREHIQAGDAGPVSMLSIREHRFPFLPKVGDWNRFNQYTGGTLVEKCCHFFDLMRNVANL